METIDAYIRVSRVSGREGPSYISPSVQRDAIERWAAYRQVHVAQWHQDEDWSGGAARRPGLDAAVHRCITRQTGGIVSWKIDRFSRLTEQGLQDLRRLREVGARLAFVVEDVDTASPIGKLVYTLMLAQAEYFLDQIKASWRVAKDRAIDRGVHIGPTPLGYERGTDSRLVPSKDAEHVAEAFRLAAIGDLGAAGAYLARRFPGRAWDASHVRRLLATRVYVGEVAQLDRRNPGAHPAIVSEAVWQAAQSSSRGRRPNGAFPLSGVLRCGLCESAMVGGRGGQGIRTYRCSHSLSTYRGERCGPGSPTIKADRVEEHVRSEAERMLDGWVAVVTDTEDARIVPLERALSEAEAELQAFASDLTLRRALGESYHRHLASRVEAVEVARSALGVVARETDPAFALSAGEILRDDETLGMWLRGLFVITVSPGRGLAVADRVRFRPVDGDGLAGVAGAETGEE